VIGQAPVIAQAAMKDAVRDIFRIASRYLLAGALFHSGMQMALNLAGIHIGPVEWVTPLGEFPGADFAGIWLGVSPLFQSLGGLVEITAGLLLLSRKTTTPGALIALGCFTNSLMLHFCFGPAPWIGDALLLIPTVYLVLLDSRVLLNLLLLDRPTMPTSTEPAWETPPTRRIGLVLKICFLFYFTYASGVQIIQAKQDGEAQSELSGAYTVESFSPPNVELKRRWRVAAIDRYAERLTVRTADGSGTTLQIQPVIPPGATTGHREHVAAITTPPGRLALVAPNGATSVLNYSRPSSGRLILNGELNGVAITAEMHLISPESLPLVNNNISFAEPR
jgi:hypothetical protein